VALAGQRIKRTLGIHGLASRPPRLEILRSLLGKNIKTIRQKPLTLRSLTLLHLNPHPNPEHPPPHDLREWQIRAPYALDGRISRQTPPPSLHNTAARLKPTFLSHAKGDNTPTR
jgi:hypothetical protein